MAIFSSRTPRDLNHDPFPYRGEYGSRHGYPGTLNGKRLERSPRPEFDHVQHNEPNPILVDVRAHIGSTSWANMLRAFTRVTEYAGHFITKDWERITDSDQIDHARKVLSRLARLTG